MKTVKKIMIVGPAIGIPLMIAMAALGFLEPYASLYTAYGWPYWTALLIILGSLIFLPVIYILASKTTIKYGRTKIITSISISGYALRLIVIIAGVMLIAAVIEDWLSLYFAEFFLHNNHYLNANGVVWSASAMGDLANWLNISPAYITVFGYRMPILYPVFILTGIILISLAILVPRYWYKKVGLWR